jgi:hypothetical protein
VLAASIIRATRIRLAGYVTHMERFNLKGRHHSGGLDLGIDGSIISEGVLEKLGMKVGLD